MSESWQARQPQTLFRTWSAQKAARSFEIDDAAGARFHVPGVGWVFDLESQTYNVNVGHRHPHVVARIREQLETLPVAAPNVLLPIREEVSRRVCEKTGMSRVFLASGGSEAVENAVKIARLVTGREKVVARRRSYHGATVGALGVAGDERREPFARSLPAGLWFDDPYPPRAPADGRPSDWLENLRALLDHEGPETIAAIIMEGFTGTNGMQLPPADLWPEARRLCDAHGILLVDDEVFSGFGRTGRWFARDHWGVQPDLMVLGKGLTSGYAPLSGVAVSARVSAHFDDHALVCGVTHYAHPLGCAAAAGSMDVLEREGLVENAHRVGEVLAARFADLKVRRSVVRDTRGLGLMRLLELDGAAAPVARRLWDLGVFAPFRGPWLFVCPPLCLQEAEAHAVADRIDDALAHTTVAVPG